jgi:hypothetical protein
MQRKKPVAFSRLENLMSVVDEHLNSVEVQALTVKPITSKVDWQESECVLDLQRIRIHSDKEAQQL